MKETAAEFLTRHGWKKMPSKRYKYGMIHYWDHPDFQRRDGHWWTQGNAVIAQRMKIKRENYPSK